MIARVAAEQHVSYLTAYLLVNVDESLGWELLVLIGEGLELLDLHETDLVRGKGIYGRCAAREVGRVDGDVVKQRVGVLVGDP